MGRPDVDGQEVGRSLPNPGFAGDAGRADPVLASVLAQYAIDHRPVPVLAALSRARLLVPVVAMLGEVEVDTRGIARDKTSDIAVVLMQGRDGRRALLAFTSLESMHAWDSAARPVPASVKDAALSAVREGASALLVDVAGPAAFVVETAELGELAAGHFLLPTSAGYAWAAAG